MIFKRAIAFIFFVTLAASALPAAAQRGPIAAPTPGGAQSQQVLAPDAAPTANVDVGGLAAMGMGDGGGFSIVTSFMRADLVVKAVMVLLLLASLWSWAIIVNKWVALSTLRRRAMSEINVTPMVDVMLVLLIVFMVTAPLLTVGVPVDLPKTRAPALGQDKEPLSVTVAKDGKVYLQKQAVDPETLVAKLQAISQNGYDQRIFVRGDKTVDYGRVMQVMGMLAAAGFTHIGLVTDVVKPDKQ